MSRRQVLSVAVLVTVLGWSVVLVAVGQPAAAAAVVPTLVLSAEQVVTAMTGGNGPLARGTGPVAGGAGPVTAGPSPVAADGPSPVTAGRGPVAADEERLG
ncbi:hypothetical protein ACIQVC_10030 [Streptomyces sp. NPDC101112]|jgi:hypothetical protein|uniref:hypothetical protein n=1 Tax=Streptomyces sp. NPDC101112 TaxID=3366105 RepID=UPI0038102F0F